MRINFELLDLRAFLVVLDLGGFHKAAEALNLSQPALSRRIQSLEAAVGAPLLERTTRRVAATSIGRSLEPLARRLIDELEESVEALTGAATANSHRSRSPAFRRRHFISCRGSSSASTRNFPTSDSGFSISPPMRRWKAWRAARPSSASTSPAALIRRSSSHRSSTILLFSRAGATTL